MKLFSCPGCQHAAHFDDLSCTHCGSELGLVPDRLALVALSNAGSALDSGSARRRCGNYEQASCNWLVGEGDATPLCLSCRLNRTIPDLSVPENETLWRRLEQEKRRLIYSVLRLQLPLAPKSQVTDGLAFDFLADPDPRFDERKRVMTGHADGLITINIAEADPVSRERARAEMAEPYRTILGHFRHESGHYYWDRLVRDSTWISPVRALFGDERADYAQALQNNYEVGPPRGWPDGFISAYATSHPWEDWAETWSHYLHIVDALETAWNYGLALDPRHGDRESLAAEPDRDPYRAGSFDELISQWLPLTVALNSLSRSMGHDAIYPFALSSTVVEKLALVHRVVHECPPEASERSNRS